MFYLKQHIETIIWQYQLQEPLHHYLKKYFKSFPKLGSRDRRALSDAVYTYYRVKPFLKDGGSVLDDVAAGLKFTGNASGFLKKIFPPENITAPLPALAQKSFPLLSEGLDKEIYFRSLWRQPDVFIRLMRNEAGNYRILKAAIPDAEIIDTPFFKNKVLRLPGNSKIQDLLSEADYVVQDLSSQQTLQYALINSQITNQTSQITNHTSIKVWDVCSGAGGKTILFKDLYPDANIIASDIRTAILQNLKERTRAYGLDDITAIAGDAVVNTDFVKPYAPFDFIICDVPCSGSGTWARTPEYFYFFDDKELPGFSARQLNITYNAQQHLKSGGYLCYITCSVFKEENEDVIEQLMAKTSLKLLHQQIIDGTKNKADSMFVAILQQ